MRVTEWWWLSFVNDEVSPNEFLGVCIVDSPHALGAVAAVRRAHELGCNPGGQVLAAPIDRPVDIRDADCHRLLDKTETTALALRFAVGKRGVTKGGEA